MTPKQLENLSYLKFLLSIEGIGPQKIFSLITKFGSFESILEALPTSLLAIEGINRTLSHRIISAKTKIDAIKEETETELDRLSKLNGRILTYWDIGYPNLLKEIYYPPIILYLLGNLDELNQNALAIVGTRMPSIYGKAQAEKFSYELAQKNLTIVSGLARGIDSIAHQSALKAGGKTIAVIGSGLDVIYPPENKKLFFEIIESGLIISEYPLGTKPDAPNFPKRNRIISGLSLGTLIIETKFTGGAMQTAAYAIDQDREIFATPGNINVKQSQGPNSLIQKGEAKLVTCTEDILEELKVKLNLVHGKSINRPNFELNLFEEKLLSALNEEPKQIDEIANITSMSVADCLVNLLMLEFKGLVRQLPGKVFSII